MARLKLSIDMRFYAGIRVALAVCISAACLIAFPGVPVDVSAADFGVRLPIVKRIDLVGNRSFDDATLKKRMRTKEARFYRIFRQPVYRRDFLRRDVESMVSFYRLNGFFEAKVEMEPVETDEKSRSVKIRLLITEGPQSRVRGLRFTGQSLISESTLRKGLKLVERSPYNPNLLETDRYTLLSKFYEDGHLGAKILQGVHTDSTNVDIEWKITPGDQLCVRATRVSGMRTVKENLVRRELTFSRGDVFRTKKILESTQNLYDTGFFSSAEIEPDSIDLANREVDLSVRVRERKTGYFETGIGVGNVYGNSVFGEWGQRNIFGTGKIFSLKSSYAFQLFPNNEFSFSKIDFRSKYIRHEGELKFPHVVGTWNTFSLGAFYERDATVEPVIIKDLGFTAQISRRFSRQTSLLFGYALERIQRLEIEEEKSHSRTRALDAAFSRDSRDFYFNPLQGTYITADGRLAGGFFGGEDNYYSLAGSLRRYMRIGGGSVFAWRVRAGYAEAFGDSRATGIPIESRFFAGGGNSVRGFKENSLGPLDADLEPLGGRVTFVTNAELRVPLPYLARFNFGAAVFVDGGTVWKSIEEISLKDFRIMADRADVTYQDYMYGIGFGFRYYTPVGPLRLDIGFPVKKSVDMDYDYRIHISLGQIF
jgi:outer membrane protein assembly complex protein YaeT